MTTVLYTIHGVIELIAVTLLAMGLFYAVRKPDGWFAKHRRCMFAFVALATLGLFVSLYTTEWKTTKPRSELSMIHGVLGVMLVVMLFLQLMWAIVVRKHISRPTYKKVHRGIATVIVALALTVVVLGILNRLKLKQQPQT